MPLRSVKYPMSQCLHVKMWHVITHGDIGISLKYGDITGYCNIKMAGAIGFDANGNVNIAP